MIATGGDRCEACQVVEFRTSQRFQINVGNPPGGKPFWRDHTPFKSHQEMVRGVVLLVEVLDIHFHLNGYTVRAVWVWLILEPMDVCRAIVSSISIFLGKGRPGYGWFVVDRTHMFCCPVTPS